MGQDPQHVFLVGVKSFGAYGGYETFSNMLTEYHSRSSRIAHHVACFQKIHAPSIEPTQAVYYDLAALWRFCRYIRKNRISHPIVYIMACRIDFFAPLFYLWIHRLGEKLYINPDGHEWMRGKWNRIIQ